MIGQELRLGGYATREVFNWRTPLLWSSLAYVPTAVSRGVLIGLGVLLLVATVATTAHEPLRAAAGNIMQGGAVVMLIAPGAVFFGESWAGMLIGLSICLYYRKQARLAVATGILALFVRELAAPYRVACVAAAGARRHWREVAAWAAGACAYGLYFGLHFLSVRAHSLPTDLAQPHFWMELGGVASLLAKARWQAWLLVCPLWVTALALTIVVAGTVAARTPLHLRLASAVYVGFFLVAGRPFNGYWGLVAWPTWALACGYGAEWLAEAASDLRGRLSQHSSSPPGAS